MMPLPVILVEMMELRQEPPSASTVMVSSGDSRIDASMPAQQDSSDLLTLRQETDSVSLVSKTAISATMELPVTTALLSGSNSRLTSPVLRSALKEILLLLMRKEDESVVPATRPALSALERLLKTDAQSAQTLMMLSPSLTKLT